MNYDQNPERHHQEPQDELQHPQKQDDPLIVPLPPLPRLQRLHRHAGRLLGRLADQLVRGQLRRQGVHALLHRLVRLDVPPRAVEALNAARLSFALHGRPDRA